MMLVVARGESPSRLTNDIAPQLLSSFGRLSSDGMQLRTFKYP